MQLTDYEWDCETIDTFGDVSDHNHADTLSGVMQFTSDTTRSNIVLVRDSLNDGRSWAYLTPTNRLPDMFTDSLGEPVAAVPKRFHREVKCFFS